MRYQYRNTMSFFSQTILENVMNELGGMEVSAYI